MTKSEKIWSYSVFVLHFILFFVWAKGNEPYLAGISGFISGMYFADIIDIKFEKKNQND